MVMSTMRRIRGGFIPRLLAVCMLAFGAAKMTGSGTVPGLTQWDLAVVAYQAWIAMLLFVRPVLGVVGVLAFAVVGLGDVVLRVSPCGCMGQVANLNGWQRSAILFLLIAICVWWLAEVRGRAAMSAKSA